MLLKVFSPKKCKHTKLGKKEKHYGYSKSFWKNLRKYPLKLGLFSGKDCR